MIVSSEERSLKLVVLQHLLCRPNLFRASVESLRKVDFFEGDTDLQWTYQIAVAYYDTFKKQVTEGALLVDLSGPEYTEMRNQVKTWFALPDDYGWSDDFVKQEILEFLGGKSMDKVRDALDEVDDRVTLRETLHGALQEVNNNVFGDIEDQNPFSDILGNLQMSSRNPTGVDFIDEILDGGVRVGEVLGFVIPTSGGKTTLGLQFADACVRQGEHAAILSSEQGLKGDITVRCFTLASRGHQRDFKDPENMVPEVKAKLMEAQPAWNKYFHFFDQRQLSVDTMQGAFNPIYQLKEKGMLPRIVVIDWWGRLKNRIMAAQPYRLSDNQLRNLSQQLLQEVKDQTEILGVTTVVLHQMAGAVAERGPKHKPSSHSAQEDKNFNNMMDFCFTVSKKDPHDNVWLRADKARSTANNEQRLKLDGGHCLFRMAEGPDNFVEDMAMLPEEGLLDGPAPAQAFDTTD
jgi:RecA/RadA recombinase